MLHCKNIRQYFLLYLLLLTGSVEAFAQDVVFTTNVGGDRMGTQDQMQISYTIQNAKNLQTLTPLNIAKDFNVLGGPYQSQSSQSYYNGQTMETVTSLTITYVIQPKRTGTLTVPAAVAKDGEGHSYQSNPVNIQVVQGSVVASQNRQRQQQRGYDPFDDDPFAAIMQQRQRQLQAMRQQQQQQSQQRQQAQPQAAPANVDLSKDLFIKVTVDKNKVHVGEQITTTYKLYARLPMNVNISKLPSLNGFWTQDFELPKTNIKPVEEVVDGKKYQVFVLKKSALFPQQTGTLELDPAEADGVARIVQQTRQRSPFADMFDDPMFQNAFGSLMMNDPFFNDDFFGGVAYKDVKVHLKSTPVKITVTPLPEDGKPADYGGAVGKFTVSGGLDKTEMTTDDALNYKITISGSGNLKLIEAPKLKAPNGLDVYDPVIIDTITGRTTTISGSKIITYPIAASTAGDYEIPAVTFSYFDVQAGKYVTLQTQPVTVHVKLGKNKGRTAIAKANLPTDIQPNSAAPLKNVSFNVKPVLFTVGYWSMYALPLMAFAGLVFVRKREDKYAGNTTLLKNKRANKVALKRLATAQKLLQQNSRKPFYDEISKAIWLYLSDKLNIPLSSLSRERAHEALAIKNVPYALQQDVDNIIDECEAALYSPAIGTKEMDNAYGKAVSIISKLEESFKA